MAFVDTGGKSREIQAGRTERFRRSPRTASGIAQSLACGRRFSGDPRPRSPAASFTCSRATARSALERGLRGGWPRRLLPFAGCAFFLANVFPRTRHKSFRSCSNLGRVGGVGPGGGVCKLDAYGCPQCLNEVGTLLLVLVAAAQKVKNSELNGIFTQSNLAFHFAHKFI